MSSTAKAGVVDINAYRHRLANLPEERFIGSILWFSITGSVTYANGRRETLPVRVTHDWLERQFEDLDLDKRFLPPKIKAVDAFRKATSEASREYPLAQDGMSALLMVREVDYDTEQVVRHVVKEIKDRRGKKLDYDPQLATLKFMRGGRTHKGKRPGGEAFKWAIMRHVTGAERKTVEELIAEADARYKDLATNLHADAIRAVIRNYLTDLNAIAVKPSGGLYFVHMSRQKTVDALHELVKRIGQGCTFHQLPLLDTVDQREMLTDAFQTEVEDEVRKLNGDIATLNEKSKGGKVAVSKYAEVKARYDAVTERSEEYTRVLGLAQGRAGAALELALDAVMDLSGRLDITPKNKK